MTAPTLRRPKARPSVPEGSPGDRLVEAVDVLWRRLDRLDGRAVVAGLVCLVVVRSGVALNRNDEAFVLAAADAFPRAVEDWRSASAIGPALAGLLGIDSAGAWYGLNVGLLVALVALVAWSALRRTSTRQAASVAAVWLALSAVPVVLLQRLGTYDVFTAAGALLVMWSRSRRLALVGGVLMGLTNAEQGVAGLVTAALVVMALRPEGDAWRDAGRELRRSAVGASIVFGLVGVTIGRLGLLGVFAAQGLSVPSRGDLFGSLLGRSLRNAVGAGAVGVFAWLGLAWAVVGLTWFLRDWSARRWAGLAAALVVVPAAVTVTTVDGTRVFAMVSLPGLLVVLGWVADRFESGTPAVRTVVTRATTLALLVAPLVPAVITEPIGRQWFPFPWAG